MWTRTCRQSWWRSQLIDKGWELCVNALKVSFLQHPYYATLGEQYIQLWTHCTFPKTLKGVPEPGCSVPGDPIIKCKPHQRNFHAVHLSWVFASLSWLYLQTIGWQLLLQQARLEHFRYAQTKIVHKLKREKAVSINRRELHRKIILLKERRSNY